MKKPFLGLIVLAVLLPLIAYGQTPPSTDSLVVQQLAAAMKADAMGDYGESFSIFKKLADLGEPISQYYVGNYYLDGLGVPKDEQQAFEWFSKAADVNYPLALLAKGKMLIAGVGTPKDMAAGIVHLMAAGSYGNEEGLALSCIAYTLYMKDDYNGYYWCLLSSRHLSHNPKFDDRVHKTKGDLETRLKTSQIQSVTAKADDWQPHDWVYPTDLFNK